MRNSNVQGYPAPINNFLRRVGKKLHVSHHQLPRLDQVVAGLQNFLGDTVNLDTAGLVNAQQCKTLVGEKNVGAISFQFQYFNLTETKVPFTCCLTIADWHSLCNDSTFSPPAHQPIMMVYPSRAIPAAAHAMAAGAPS